MAEEAPNKDVARTLPNVSLKTAPDRPSRRPKTTPDGMLVRAHRTLSTQTALGPWTPEQAASTALPLLPMAAGCQRAMQALEHMGRRPRPQRAEACPASMPVPKLLGKSSSVEAPAPSPNRHTRMKRLPSDGEVRRHVKTAPQRRQQLVEDPEYMDRRIDELRRARKCPHAAPEECGSDALRESSYLYGPAAAPARRRKDGSSPHRAESKAPSKEKGPAGDLVAELRDLRFTMRRSQYHTLDAFGLDPRATFSREGGSRPGMGDSLRDPRKAETSHAFFKAPGRPRGESAMYMTF